MTGPDVQQLNQNLVALGYASDAELDSNSQEFTAATEAGVKALQAALGCEQTGSLAPGYVAFLPSAVRVESLATAVGALIQPGATVLEGSATTPVVSVALEPGLQSLVDIGDAVTITLPDRQRTEGTVASIGLRRALGATKGHIRLQFHSEAILLALLGGLVGLAAGVGSTSVYALVEGWPIVSPTLAWAGGLGAALLIGAWAGLLPALKARNSLLATRSGAFRA